MAIQSRSIGRALALVALYALMGCSQDANSNPDASAGVDGQGVATTRVLCGRYVECVAQTNPGGLKIIADQYGKSGTCFDSLGDDLCRKACLTGLQQNRTAFPNEGACPSCLADADCASTGKPACDKKQGLCVVCADDSHCSGSTPACDTAKQRCVTCMADKHCTSSSKPACDVSAQRCIRCAGDQHCKAPTPACEASIGKCFECTKNSHCSSSSNPSCDTANRKCCTVPSCGAIKALIGTNRWICGTHHTQCGAKECGTCSIGTCSSGGQCETTGKACVAGSTGTCAVGELCALDMWDKKYKCGYDHTGAACDALIKKCDTGFTCVNKTCRQFCKKTADCVGGRACTLYKGVNYGDCG